ncbi:unnamed protein product [Closterium sp. Naga37s-1]|nr:unnamed protein product [Closterium sp. Naga37s-1]
MTEPITEPMADLMAEPAMADRHHLIPKATAWAVSPPPSFEAPQTSWAICSPPQHTFPARPLKGHENAPLLPPVALPLPALALPLPLPALHVESSSRVVVNRVLLVVAAVVAAWVVWANWRMLTSDWFLTIQAKLIGYYLIAQSTVLKLPQIMRIVQSSSVDGLSVTMFELECVGYTVSLLFCWTRRVPFSAYGELFFLLLQALILVLLIYHHSPELGSKRYQRAGL